MKILLDSNILIQRENNSVLPKNIAQLMQIIGQLNYPTCIHALSLAEIHKDGNIERRKINISKLSSYPILDKYPNYLEDHTFVSMIPPAKNENDIIDNQLLYCVYKGLVSHLITEDHELLHKADLVGVETVYSVNEAIEIFSANMPKSNIDLASTFEEIKPFEIDIDDPIFDTLKSSYPEFKDTWWKKVVESNRIVYLFKDNSTNRINAILIPKIEDESIECDPAIPRNKYVKICLFKVAPHAQGLKLGEHLLGLAIEFAKLNKIDKLYLTHFREEKDYLIYLIEDYGFILRGKNRRGEEIYTKEIVPPNAILESINDPIKLNKIYYPSFMDGANINKYIVPIQPQYHKMLFPKYKHKSRNIFKQIPLFKIRDNIKSHGYSIKKAYLSHSFVSSMKSGDLLLFYRTEDYKAITTIGVVEQVYTGIRDSEQIKKLTAKRTVFTDSAIDEMCQKDTTVILFRWCMHLDKEVKYEDLIKNGIISGQIQRMQSLSNEKYEEIIKGNIDECFTIH